MLIWQNNLFFLRYHGQTDKWHLNSLNFPQRSQLIETYRSQENSTWITTFNIAYFNMERFAFYRSLVVILVCLSQKNQSLEDSNSTNTRSSAAVMTSTPNATERPVSIYLCIYIIMTGQNKPLLGFLNDLAKVVQYWPILIFISSKIIYYVHSRCFAWRSKVLEFII